MKSTMNKENTEKLLADFSRLYRERDRSALHWGFQCDDGWFDLLYDLSAKIETKARELGIDPASEDWPHAMGVKEKFGKLRFLVVAPKSTDAINELISEAEEKSATTCELCGQPGTLRPGSWWQVRCDACQSRKMRGVAL